MCIASISVLVLLLLIFIGAISGLSVHGALMDLGESENSAAHYFLFYLPSFYEDCVDSSHPASSFVTVFFFSSFFFSFSVLTFCPFLPPCFLPIFFFFFFFSFQAYYCLN